MANMKSAEDVAFGDDLYGIIYSESNKMYYHDVYNNESKLLMETEGDVIDGIFNGDIYFYRYLCI
ncbi:hypothetical protein ACFL1H_08130 [Nanoarchaeota archaeon]